MLKIIFSSILYCLIFTNVFAQEYTTLGVNIKNIEIVRDNYGVPHIFTKTDVEAVYGIAWAQCEDNFNRMQENLAASKGVAGRLLGKDGAVLDFIYQSFEIDDFVNRQYQQDISPQIDKMLKAYTSAINKYAATHPEEVAVKQLFPVSHKKMLGTYTLNLLLTHSSILELAKVLSNKFEYGELNDIGRGSNALAFSKNITADGKAYLIGNPHQPVNHFANFWEVSVHSEEGYEMYGATFSGGGLTPVIGTNRHLGWSHTTNYQNCSDVYKLQMHPTKKNHYQYDGEWLPLEQKKAKLKVKIGGIVIPIGKKYYWSKYGPTFKKKQGYFSYKSNSFFNLKAPEQWYKMGLATNIEAFNDALAIQGIPLQTITYADKDGNIWHISSTNHPIRNEDFDWSGVLPGNTSASNWIWDADNLYPISRAIQVKNPDCGYVYNCNNTPLKMTSPNENPRNEDYPRSFGILTSNTIRANTFEHLIKKYDKISFEEARAIRETVKIDKNKMSFRNCMNCDDIPRIMNSYPKLKAVKKVFDKWDGSYDIHNKQATLMSISTMFFVDYVVANFGNIEQDIPEAVIVKAILKAEKFMLKHYGTLEIELGTIQKAVRHDVSLPMYGNLNTLANSQFKHHKKGQLEITNGDSFIFYAKFGADGLEELNTINAFGNSNKKGHPHSTDQTEMYVNKRTKQAELHINKLKESGRIYHPQ